MARRIVSDADGVNGAGAAHAFMFQFVSIAYAMSITDVFPVIYQAVRACYHYIEEMPEVSFLLLGSQQHWSSMAPYLDKACLVGAVCVWWIVYYFLIAGIHGVLDQRYRLRYLVWDMAVALVYYFAARSVENYDEKGIVEQDSTWILVCAALLMQFVRIADALCRIPFASDLTALIRGQNVGRMLLAAAHTTAAMVSLCVLGFVYDRTALDFTRITMSLSCAVGSYAVLVLMMYGLVRLLARKDAIAGGSATKPVAIGWQWMWERHRTWVLGGAVVICACLVFVRHSQDTMLPLLIRYRAGVPLGMLNLGATLVGLLLAVVFRIQPIVSTEDLRWLVGNSLDATRSVVERIHGRTLVLVVVIREPEERNVRIFARTGSIKKEIKLGVVQLFDPVVSALTPRRGKGAKGAPIASFGVNGVNDYVVPKPMKDVQGALKSHLAIPVFVDSQDGGICGVMFCLGSPDDSSLLADAEVQRLLTSVSQQFASWFAASLPSGAAAG